MIASPLVTRAMRARHGHLFVRGVFGDDPVRARHRPDPESFAGCHGTGAATSWSALATMNLLEGIATMDVPTTVMVGSRDTLTLPKKADQIVSTVPGARLVTLPGRGHMLPSEDPDAVTDEIVRAVKG